MKRENESVVESLDNYLLSDSPKFAVLIDGKWGSGKTHFIKEDYIDREIGGPEDTLEDKSLYITLAGCSSIKELHKRVVQGKYK